MKRADSTAFIWPYNAKIVGVIGCDRGWMVSYTEQSVRGRRIDTYNFALREPMPEFQGNNLPFSFVMFVPRAYESETCARR